MARETMQFRNPAGHAGLLNSLLSLANSLAEFATSRLTLAASESKAAFVHVLVLVGFLIAAGGLVAFGYVFLLVSAVVGIAHALHISWVWVALGAAGIHFLMAAICLIVVGFRIKKPIFEYTSVELKKDREWLKALDKKNRPAK